MKNRLIQENLTVMFCVVGGLTSYLDLLTTPIVALGILLVILTLRDSRQIHIRQIISWFLGYVALWSTKWILAAALFAPGAIATSLNQILIRTSAVDDQNFSHIVTLKLNLFQLMG